MAQSILTSELGQFSERRGITLARAQAVLDRYGVTTNDKITQSRARWRGHWRVLAEPRATS